MAGSGGGREVTTVWRDGRLIESEPGAAPVEAGWGAFTTVGCDGGHPLLWTRHRSRLAASLRFLGAGNDVALPDEPALRELLRARGFDGAARLRVVGRRKQTSGWTVEASVSRCEAAGPDAPPVRLTLQRWLSAPPLVGHKTLARLPWDLARERARRESADDALLVDEAGHVLETAIANVWLCWGRELRTPPAPARCLPGIMRGWLLEHAEDLGLQVFECDLTEADLLGADELWISNAVIGVRRVASLHFSLASSSGRRCTTPSGVFSLRGAGRTGKYDSAPLRSKTPPGAAPRHPRHETRREMQASITGQEWRSWPLFEHLAELGVPAPGW